MKSILETSTEYLNEKVIPDHLRIAQALAYVATTASTADDLSKVLNIICEQAARVLQSPSVIIRLYNPQNDMLEVAGSYGLDAGYLERNFAIPRAPRLHLTDPNGPRLVITQLDQSPPSPVDQLPHRQQLHTSVVCNMVRQGEFIGVLVILLPKEKSLLSEEERFFIETLAEQASISVERFRLAKSQEKRIQEMEEFVRLSNDLRNVQSKPEMATALLWGAQKLFQAERGVAFLFENQIANVQNSFGYDEKMDLQASFEECPYLSTLRSGTTIIIEDVQQHPSLVRQNCFEKPLQGSRSTIFIPLCYSHQLIGLVVLTYSQIVKFDDTLLSTFHLFQEIVDSAMVRLEIMENLERMVLDRTRDLRALYDITTLLNTPIRFDEGIIEVLKRTLSLTSAQATSIHTYEEKNNKIGLLQQVGFSELMVNQIQNFHPFLEILQEVILQGSAVYYDNIVEKISQLQNTVIHQQLSYLGIPIKARGKPLGVLSVVGLSKPFSINDQILLIAIADHLGLFIERNRLAVQAEEAAKLEERQRLARELHDALTQSLYSMTLLSKAYQRALPYSDKEEMLRWLKEFNSISQDAMKELRLLLYELRPAALEQDGLGGALKRRLETVEKRAGIEAHLVINGYFRLSAEEEEIIYRIIQEALNNSLQHAHHHHLEILFQSTGKEWNIQIKDDGVGFNPQSVAQNTNGMGLMNMKTRASQIGAELIIISAPAQGTTILLRKEFQHE